MIVVLSGPGGVGKGTIAEALVRRDPHLWLSRSWTSRPQRPGEPDDSYVFASREEFELRLAENGFLEHTEFLGHYYGTPTPHPPPGKDLLLEIELDGAQQVRRIHPDALLVFVLPPTRAEQERRLRGRGDPVAKVAERLLKAESEEPVGRQLADQLVVNDDLGRAVDEIAHAIELARKERGSG